MHVQFDQDKELRFTVHYGLEQSVIWVKSYGSLRCVYRHRNNVTTPEPDQDRKDLGGRKKECRHGC